MIQRLIAKFSLVLLSCGLVTSLHSAETATGSNVDQVKSPQSAPKPGAAFCPLKPGPDDGRIAFVTARMLEQFQYSRQRFNDSVSSKFFDRYFDLLDPQHLHFLQSDLADFERYRTNLDRLTVPPPPHGVGDTTPASEIFNRFVERIAQRVAYVDELLKGEKFTFEADERILINRHEMPYPKDLDEANKLWRERLRYEYLQEKFGKIASRKRPQPATGQNEIPLTQTNASPRVPASPKQPDQDTRSEKPHNLQPGELQLNKTADNAGTRQVQSHSAAQPPATLPNLPAPTPATPGVSQGNVESTAASPGLTAQTGAEKGRYPVLRSPKEKERTRPVQTESKTRPTEAPEFEASTGPSRAQAEGKPGNRSAIEQDAPIATPALAKRPESAAKSEADEIIETLSHRYHRNLRMYTDWNSDDVLQAYLSALTHVYDPHSDYLGHAQLDAFSIGMNLSLFGIGAQLLSEDGYCTIQKLLPGGPAIKSNKIKEKDRILAVAQSNQPPVDIVDMNLGKAVQLIRGPKGTEVRLTLLPAGADASSRVVVSLIRDEIPLEESAAKARIIELPNGHGGNLRLGVIDLPSFYAPFDPTNARDKSGPKSTTTADVAKLLKKLEQENIEGLILDLRRNGGGSLEEAIKLTGLFIKEGPVVQVRDWNGNIQVDNDNDPAMLYSGPLVVLTSRFSASASEIVAGALQDYGRAVMVGDSSTHGKGTVQSVNPLQSYLRPGDTNDPGAVKITIKKFYRPSGASTQKNGVTPDIVLPSIWNESKDIGESALENPLPWDTIRSANFEHLSLVEPYLPELRKHSAQRVAADPEFAYVREDIEQLKKAQADKTISLNEKQRLKEKDEADARLKARDRERLARNEPQEKVYELTLKLADQPGLPPPVQKTNPVVARVSGPGRPVLPGVSTNSAAIVPKGVTPEHALNEDSEEEKPPPVDATLDEAEHILVDYLSVFPAHDIATAGH